MIHVLTNYQSRLVMDRRLSSDLDCVDCNPLDTVNMSCWYVYELNIIMNF